MIRTYINTIFTIQIVDTNQSNQRMTKDKSSTSQKGQIQSRAPPNLEKASAEEEVINHNIKSSSFWSFPQEKSYVNKVGSL